MKALSASHTISSENALNMQQDLLLDQVLQMETLTTKQAAYLIPLRILQKTQTTTQTRLLIVKVQSTFSETVLVEDQPAQTLEPPEVTQIQVTNLELDQTIQTSYQNAKNMTFSATVFEHLKTTTESQILSLAKK